MKTVLLFLMVALSACNQPATDQPAELVSPLTAAAPAVPAPIVTPIPAVTPSPSPSPTVTPVTVISLESTDFWHICHDLENWNPVTTTVQVADAPFSLSGWTFAASGVTHGNLDGTNQTVVASLILNIANPGNCRITVTNGQIVSIQ